MALWQRSLQTIGSTLALGLISTGAAWAQGNPLVIIRSSVTGQQYQWSSLSQRLNQANLHYCTVEQTMAALPSPQPGQGLLLPSINAIDSEQVSQLQQWLQAGGQVIVTGPTGSLSSQQVRSQLQDLLGSRWAYPLPTATPLTLTAEFPNATTLTAPDRGATVLPSQSNAEVLAQWQTQRPTPAVVVTEQTATLGWQWGQDTVTDAATDVAWLQAIIHHQAIPTTTAQAGTGATCAELLASATDLDKPAIVPTSPSTAMGGTTPPPNPQNAISPSIPVNPAPTVEIPETPHPDLLAAVPRNLYRRYAQLQQFVGRYESAIIAAETQSLTDVTFLDTVQQRANPQLGSTPALPQRLQTVRAGMARINQFLAARDYRGAGTAIQALERQLWADYPLDQPTNHTETRAMWLDRGTIVRARSERELARVFNRLANAGINTVFFETLNASYPIYPSQVAPEQNPLTRGWDPLAAAVKLAHERGMELHAWVWIFAAANQQHNAVMGQPRTYLGPVLSRNPDWAMSDRRGNPFQPNSRKAFFDPANPEVRAYLTSILDEIATNYDVDGIQLDYIRYPFQDPRKDLTFGYGIAARRQFYQLTGVDPATIRPRDRLWQQWTRFRIQQVTGFVEEATTMLRRDHPDVLISAAVFPFPAHERLPKLQQNWETWIDQDYLDFLVPMTYAEDTAEFQTITSPVINHMSRGSTLLMPGIRLLKLPTVVAFDQLQHLRDQPTSGYALFAAENLSLNLQALLQSQQGRRTSRTTEPIAHRQPLVTAHARYQALQKEWQYWAAHESVNLDARTLEQWATQSALVEERLAAAAESPSRANLRQAQTQLAQFERQFAQWLRPMASDSSYRVQVWQNRLAGVGQLLRYGQRRGLQ